MENQIITERSHGYHKIQSSSVDAYIGIQNLSGKRLEVYEQIRLMNESNFFPTDKEVMKELGYVDPNKVRPRRKELFDLGLIEEFGKKVCSVSKQLVLCWRVVDYEPIFKQDGDDLIQTKFFPDKEDWLKLRACMDKRGYSYTGNYRWTKTK